MPLHRGLQRHYTAHRWLLWQKKKRYILYSGEKHGGSLCGRQNENKCEPFCTMNQVSLVTHSSVALYTPTQAHSCKSGLLKDDCTPASNLELKSTTHRLWLLTTRVKSTELTQNPTKQTNYSWSISLWLRCSSQASPLKTERSSVVSVTEEEFRKLLLWIYSHF